MRHGYEWWETFWKWLDIQSFEDYPVISLQPSNDVAKWLNRKYREFSELWRTGKIRLPPKGREI